MPVVATAGHVDHGKSTLVRALTGRDPDRWAEEKRRGLTLDLGFAWTELDGPVAFVDVPGHEKFVPTMLAGVGPVPVVLFVVAADGGWMPQSAEHLAALDALGVRHGLLVVTRADLADPAPSQDRALRELAGTSLAGIGSLACSAATGQGLEEIRSALAAVLRAIPAPDDGAPVRLWVDRSFTVTGAGTVVTGTLAAGSVAVGDELLLGTRAVRVRALQTMEQDVERVGAVARVALNLRGVERGEVRRGDALITPGTALVADVVDVRAAAELPGRLTVHLGSAAVGARVRPLGGEFARLHLDRSLPLRLGDRLLLREPARHEVLGAGVVLDVDPLELRRRGAARARAAELSEGFRRPLESGVRLRALGIEPTGERVAGDWYADPEFWATARERCAEFEERFAVEHPLRPGPTVEEVRRALDLPADELAEALRGHRSDGLPPDVANAVEDVLADLADRPFAAPDASRLSGLGLGRAELAAAVRVGVLVRVADGVVLAPGFDERAAETLTALAEPFSVGEAARALGTSRRVAVPVLEVLDAQGRTVRDADGRRRWNGR
jgi:selenocysteine-specific elongation factor